MASFADRVKETTTTTGTGSLTLAGAASGYQSFASAFASGSQVYYAISGGTQWEVGLGTFTSPSTLARTAVYASSNSGSAVSLGAGTKDVFCTIPARYAANGRHVFDVRDYGAVIDCRRLTDIVTTSGGATATSATAGFTSADTGKYAHIIRQSDNSTVFRGTITYVNATTITLASTAAATLSSGQGYAYFGTDNATAINAALSAADDVADQAAISANYPLGGGKPLVYIPTGATDKALFSGQLTANKNVAIHADAMLVSTCGSGASNRTWSMVLKEGCDILRLAMDCGFGMGIKVGTASQNAHTSIGELTLWSVGGNYNGALTPTSQIGLYLTGYDFFINRYWVKGANVGLQCDNASDVMANHLFLIGCGSGCMLVSSEQVMLGSVAIDTGSYSGVTIDGSRNVTVNARAFAINSTALSYGMLIGENDSTNKNRNLRISFDAQRIGAASGVVKVGNTLDSTIDVQATNEAIYSSGGTNISGACVVYGSGNGGSLDITLNRDGAITTATSGTRTGVLRDVCDGTETFYGTFAFPQATQAGITIDGGGSAITTGVKGYIAIPYGATITGWTLLGDQSGSIVIDVWKDTYANYPPTSGDSIAGTEKPTLSSAAKAQDLSLSTWTTAVTAGDVLGFSVSSASAVTRVTLLIHMTRS